MTSDNVQEQISHDPATGAHTSSTVYIQCRFVIRLRYQFYKEICQYLDLKRCINSKILYFHSHKVYFSYNLHFFNPIYFLAISIVSVPAKYAMSFHLISHVSWNFVNLSTFLFNCWLLLRWLLLL